MQHSNSSPLQRRGRCPICHSTSSVLLCKESYSSYAMKKYIDTHYKGMASLGILEASDYELVQCANCNLAYQEFVPTSSMLTEIYDGWIPKAIEAGVGCPLGLAEYRYISDEIQFMIEHFQLMPYSINVLDFGFGRAEWAAMAMAYGCNVSGSDLSQKSVERAQSIGLKTLDLDDLPVNHFHFINTEQVMEHVVDPRALLTRLVTSLRADGVIKISVPNSISCLRKLKKTRDFSSLSQNSIMPVAPLEHVNSFDYESLVVLGKMVGLQPFRPSFRKLYNGSSGWVDIKNFLRLISRPFYRHIFPKSTYVYFVLDQNSDAKEQTGSRIA